MAYKNEAKLKAYQKAYHKKYQQDNREALALYDMAKYEAHKEDILEKKRIYYQDKKSR